MWIPVPVTSIDGDHWPWARAVCHRLEEPTLERGDIPKRAVAWLFAVSVKHHDDAPANRRADVLAGSDGVSQRFGDVPRNRNRPLSLGPTVFEGQCSGGTETRHRRSG